LIEPDSHSHGSLETYGGLSTVLIGRMLVLPNNRFHPFQVCIPATVPSLPKSIISICCGLLVLLVVEFEYD